MPARKKAASRAKPQYSFAKISKARTKGEILVGIAESVELPRKQVSQVFDALSAMIAQDLGRVGMFTLPGLAKMTLVKKPATKARKGINPFTGEPTVFKAKPARKVVKIRPLAGLKKAVS
jgi:nucleoid DNA-binding protein